MAETPETKWCEHVLEDEALEARYREMMAGSNHQPCEDCGKHVKAEFCFCHVCGRVFCDDHFQAHLTSGVPVGKRLSRYEVVSGD